MSDVSRVGTGSRYLSGATGLCLVPRREGMRRQMAAPSWLCRGRNHSFQYLVFDVSKTYVLVYLWYS